MSRTVRIGLALVLAQAALVGAYWLVEQRRSNREAESTLGIEAPTPVDGEMPRLTLTNRAGETFVWTATDRPTLVHVWATWCPPCRTELPGLLGLPEDHAIDVVAIALDREWADVDRFFAEPPPPAVFLGDSARVEAELDVHTLPVTFLIESGRIRLRFDGARDWADAGFRRTWLRASASR
jgi:thiol-disulfide isomerase/thioredoxin